MKTEGNNRGPLANHLLASLSYSNFDEVFPLLKSIAINQGDVLQDPGEEAEHVYFPHNGMISLLAVMKDGRAVQTAGIGAEGAVSALAGIGPHCPSTRAVAQLPLVASQVSSVALRKTARSSDELRIMLLRAHEAVLAQVQITAACNALHTVEQKLARWLLQSGNGGGSTIPLTQEMIAQMLGVTRGSISEAAQKLQERGLIRYVRGKVEILDRQGLENGACECYATIRDATHRI